MTGASPLFLFLRFLRFGVHAWGGPIAQIAMLRRALVDEEQWLDGAHFNRLLAAYQLLPGPEAHELCVHLGLLRGGRWGGLAAGLGFMLPGLILMLALAMLYDRLPLDQPRLAAALGGVQLAVLALILIALLRLGRATLRRTGQAVIALAALALGLWWGAAPAAPPATEAAAASGATLAALFIAGLKGGLLTFGGAYSAIPFVRADTVGQGWISDARFLDGVAVAGMIPAPLVMFVTFVGYGIAGLSGAMVMTLGMFVPAFAMGLLLHDRIEALVAHRRLHALLEAAAAVIGAIAATAIDLLRDRLAQPSPAMLMILAGALLGFGGLRGGLWTPLLLALAALAGAAAL